MTRNPTPAATARQQTGVMRWLLLVSAGLVFVSGFQLFVLSEHTDRFFAWTVKPPLTAAVLGAAYWASFVLELMASRQRLWAGARIAVPPVLIFSTLTLIATVPHLLHHAHLHQHTVTPLTRIAAIAWIAIYVIVPPVMAVILWHQVRVPGADPPRQAPLAA